MPQRAVGSFLALIPRAARPGLDRTGRRPARARLPVRGARRRRRARRHRLRRLARLPRFPSLNPESSMDRRRFIQSGSAAAALGALPLAAPRAGTPEGRADRRQRVRPELAGHPHRRRQPPELRRELDLLRPADDLRQEDAARRPRRLRPQQARARARRELADRARRQLGHLQAAQEREVPRRHAGHREGREVELRPRRHRRRLPDLPDGRRLAREARAVRGRRRPHLQRQVPAQGQADDERPGGAGAVHLQQRAGEEERHRGRTPGAWPGRATTSPAAAPTRSRPSAPGRRSSTCATTTGRAARCRSCAASCSARCPTPATAARCCVKGDIDITYDLPPKDFSELSQGRRGGQGDQHADRERDVLPRHERHQAAVRQPEGAPGGRLRAALRQDRTTTRCTAARIKLYGAPQPEGRAAPRGRSPPATRPTSPRPRR